MKVRSKFLSFGIAAVLAFAACVAPASAQGVGSTVKIGNPSWDVTGFVLFSAPIGTPASNFAEFLESAHTALPSPNYEINPATFGIAPVPAHAGPYDNEFVEGVNSSGFKQGPDFDEADFSGANGIFFGWMMVPGADAPEGSSPDYASGPIIPNELFDMALSAEYRRNGQIFDNAFPPAAFDVNANLAGLVPAGTTFEGYSHNPQFLATGGVFGPAGLTSVAGDYTVSATLIDKQGNGYTTSTSFTIRPNAVAVPLPPAALTLLPTLAGLWGASTLRRRIRRM